MRIALIFITLSWCFCLNAAAQILTLTTEDYPPFDMVDPKTGNISGISAEKVVELMRRAKSTYTLKSYPWARSFQMAQTTPNTCVYSTSRTPEREAMFKWIGPLVQNNWVIFKRADDPRKPKSLEDLRPYLLGTYRDDAVQEFLAMKGYQTDIANSDNNNPRKLLARRFDFWATGEKHAAVILKNQGLSKKFVQLFSFHQSHLYLACHASMAQKRVDHYNRLLKQMENDGTMAAIEKKY